MKASFRLMSSPRTRAGLVSACVHIASALACSAWHEVRLPAGQAQPALEQQHVCSVQAAAWPRPRFRPTHPRTRNIRRGSVHGKADARAIQ